MNKSIGWFVACLLGVVACNVEHVEDCNPDDPLAGGDDFGGTHSGYAGSKASGGHSAGSGGSVSTQAGGGSGATAATAGSSVTSDGGYAQNDGSGGSNEAGAPATAAPPTPCEKERDCAPGYNCDLDQHQCLPADQETCGELDTELACTNRKDCTPVYGGVNCSCGTNCECHGGEQGCVCESFQFFICDSVSAAP